LTGTSDSSSSSSSLLSPLVPDLSPEQKHRASKFLSKKSPLDENEIITEKFNIQVTRKMLACLRKLEWLSDEVVNFYFSMIQESFANVFCWNSFFYTKLTMSGYSGVRNWLTIRGVDVFNQENVVMLIPIHISDQAHWALGVVDMGEKTTSYLDSLGSENDVFHETILEYLKNE
jgi:sentrin-specific protease 1